MYATKKDRQTNRNKLNVQINIFRQYYILAVLWNMHEPNEFYKILPQIKVLRNLSGNALANTYCIEQAIQ